MSQKKTNPEQIWAMAVNLGGLWATKPIRFTYDHALQTWFDESGDLQVHVIGLDVNKYITIFASPNIEDVHLFSEGAKAMARAISNVIDNE